MNEYHTFVVELILSVGSVITSIASCIAAWHGIRNSRTLQSIHAGVRRIEYTPLPPLILTEKDIVK